MNKKQIFQIYGKAYKENTITLLKEADLASLIPSTSTRIAIKPNLVSSTEASWGATTHPEIIAGIIESLHDHNFYDITIMEGSWVGDRTSDAFDICGYTDLSRRYDVPLVDLQKAKSVKKNCDGMDLNICRPALETEFLINVPVLKGHCQTRITCALKNLKGMIPNSEKRRFHSMGLHKPIAHLAAAMKQDFIVVDHICGDLDFEDGGNPVVRNGIFAGRDPVLMDALVCRMLHYQTKDVPYLKLAEKLGVGSTDLDAAEIHLIEAGSPGDNTTKAIHKDLQSAEGGGSLSLPRRAVQVEDAVWEVESCSACYGSLIPALSRLQEEELLSDLSEKICIGQGFKEKTGALGVGNCTRKFDTCIAGCPPSEEQIYESLKNYILS